MVSWTCFWYEHDNSKKKYGKTKKKKWCETSAYIFQRIRIDRGKKVTTFVWCLRKINHSLWCFNSPYCTKLMGSTVFRRANILSKKRNVPLKIPADSVYVLSKENVTVALKVVICDATLQFIIIVRASGSWLFTKTWNVSCHISFHLFVVVVVSKSSVKGVQVNWPMSTVPTLNAARSITVNYLFTKVLKRCKSLTRCYC